MRSKKIKSLFKSNFGTVLLVLIISVFFPFTVFAQGATYFPHVASNSMWETEICIINTSSEQSLSGELKAYNHSGQEVSLETIMLASNARREIIVGDELPNPSGIGYMIFESDTENVFGYTKFYIEGKYRVAVPATSDVNTGDIYISHIASSSEWATGVSILNTSGASKALTIEFDNGVTKTVDIEANEHRAFNIRDLFDGEAQPDINSGVIKNGNGIVGLELFASSESSGTSYLSGILLKDDTTTEIYYPHIASDSIWATGIVAYNPSDTSCDLTITCFSDEGTILTTKTITLNGKEKYIGTVDNLNFPAMTAWFSIEASNPITGFELFSTLDGKQLGGYTGVNISGKNGVFAKIEKDGGTGIAFVNIENAPAIVNMTAYNDTGASIATEELNLDAYEKVVGMPSDLFAQDISIATYIAYASDREVVGFQLNSSSDGMMLDALPAIGGVYYTVGGMVSGLTGNGLVLKNILKNKGTDNLIVSSNGAFVFGTAHPDGTSYNVIVSSHPTDQTCSVTNGRGTISGANVTDIMVNCTDGTYTVGGTITGLTGDGLVLKNNGTHDLSVAAHADTFTFGTALPDGASYSVTVSSQPAGQTCTVAIANDSGAISGADVGNVNVVCIDGSYRLSQVQIDKDNDGNVDDVETYTYDSGGNRTTYRFDADNDANIDETYEYTYNISNYLTSYTEDEDGSDDTHTYSLISSGKPVGLPSLDDCDKDDPVDDNSDYRINYTFDTNGYPTNLAFENLNSVTSIQFYMWGNNFKCHANKGTAINWDAYRPTKLNKQIYDSGRIFVFSDFEWSFTYDADCNLTYWDAGVESKIYTYDSKGYLSKIETDSGKDGTIDEIETYAYDASGNRTKVNHDSDADGTYESSITFSYNADGKMTKMETENDADPEADYTEVFTYDANGFLENKTIDTNGDGVFDYVLDYMWIDITM